MKLEIDLPGQYDNLDVAVVGGFPRDLYLGKERNDVDLVVTGVTPDEMRQRGFRHIMSSNEREPVFVDQAGREVAIARTERSTGEGHTEFNMDIVDPDIGHEEALRRDLERRDLTINAIAVDARTGDVFDPFNGRSDIEDGVIRHVSSAFSEDPLRVVRTARYAARFEFSIQQTTQELMEETATSIESLSRGRLGGELTKSLAQAQTPRRFFDILRETNALRFAYPVIYDLTQVPAGPQEYHQEGTAYEHTMRVLDHMHDRRGNDVPSLLSALFHDIGKSDTPEDVLPHHYGHEDRGSEIALELRRELQLSRDLRGAMSTAAEVHGNLGQINELNVTTILDICGRIIDSPLTTEMVADLVVCDGLGRDPQMEIDRENLLSTLNQASDVIEEIGGEEALKSRGMDQSDIGDTISGETVGNIIRQDRAEELRRRIL